MTFKNLEKATKLYEKIKQLDSEIIEIEKFALTVANNDTECSFELKCKDLTKQKEGEEKVKIDEDGSLLDGLRYTSLLNPYSFLSSIPRIPAEDKNETIIKGQLSVNNVMAMLGILLNDKQTKRQYLIDKLSQLS